MSLPPANMMAGFPEPEENGPGTLSTALRALASVDSETTAWRAYDALLYAVGNNHAGTYYPIVLIMMPGLGELLRRGLSWTQFAIVQALTDLVFSFEPAPGFEAFHAANGNTARPLRDQLMAEAVALLPTIEDIAARAGPAAIPARELAEGLRNRKAR